MRRFESADDLRHLFLSCQLAVECQPREYTDEVHDIAEHQIIARLVQLNNTEGAATLVGLLEDEAVHLDGELALHILLAISDCGKNALEPLRKFEGTRKHHVPKLIEAIEKGESYGP